MTRSIALGAALIACIAAVACSKKDDAQAAATANVPLESKEIFQQRCATCHGADGKGSGPAAAALNPKPRDYSNKSWQASVSDDLLRKTIVEGGASVGKSALMPANPDLRKNPIVVDGLVTIVRSFGG